jgi:hypothetical protein
MNYKNVVLMASFDQSQLSLSDFSGQVLLALQQLGPYAVKSITTTATVQAQWNGASFVNGLSEINMILGVPAGMLDDAVAAIVSYVISTLFLPLSSTGSPVIESCTVIDCSPAPVPGPPQPGSFPIL